MLFHTAKRGTLITMCSRTWTTGGARWYTREVSLSQASCRGSFFVPFLPPCRLLAGWDRRRRGGAGEAAHQLGQLRDLAAHPLQLNAVLVQLVDHAAVVLPRVAPIGDEIPHDLGDRETHP